MATILPKEKDYGDYAKEAIEGFTEGYQNRHDEMALQKAIENLPPNATARQRLDAITGAKVYNQANKQNVFKNILGAEEFEETKRHHQEVENINKATKQIQENKQKIEENKVNEQINLGKGELQEKKDARTAKETETQKKDIEKRQAIRNVVSSIPGLSDEQKETLGNSLTEQGAQKLLQESFKAPKQSEFEKNVEKANAEKYINLSEEIEKVKGTLTSLDHLQELVNSLGTLGTAASLVGLSGTAKEIEGIGFTVVEPIFKLLNPGGGILAAYKVKEAQNKFGVKATDAPWTKNAKIRALRYFSNQAMDRAKRKIDLISKYNGKPPPDLVEKFDRETETIQDAALNYDITGEELTGEGLPAAAKYKDKTFDTPLGRVYSDGTRWLKKPQ